MTDNQGLRPAINAELEEHRKQQIWAQHREEKEALNRRLLEALDQQPSQNEEKGNV